MNMIIIEHHNRVVLTPHSEKGISLDTIKVPMAVFMETLFQVARKKEYQVFERWPDGFMNKLA